MNTEHALTQASALGVVTTIARLRSCSVVTRVHRACGDRRAVGSALARSEHSLRVARMHNLQLQKQWRRQPWIVMMTTADATCPEGPQCPRRRHGARAPSGQRPECVDAQSTLSLTDPDTCLAVILATIGSEDVNDPPRCNGSSSDATSPAQHQPVTSVHVHSYSAPWHDRPPRGTSGREQSPWLRLVAAPPVCNEWHAVLTSQTRPRCYETVADEDIA